MYLTISVLTVVSLAAIRWVFSQYLPSVEIKEELWEFWIPLVFPIIPIAVWLRPRLRILSFDKEADTRRFLILMIASGSMIIPSVVIQEYVFKAMSDLNEIDSVFDIATSRPDRYYKIRDFEVAEKFGGAHADVSVSGRSNSDMNFKFYFSFPITSSGEGVSSNHSYWYGLSHRKRISNRVSDQEKEREYLSAYEKGVAMAESHDFSSQEYFEVVQASDDRDHYRQAAASRLGSNPGDGVVILVPGDGAFENRTRDWLDWILASFGIGFAAFLLIIAWPSCDARELKKQRQGEMPKGELLDGLAEFFVPRNDYFAAPIILDAIILTFLIVTFSGVHPVSPSAGDLLEWGANRRAETAGGQWWRLLTSMFLHGGVMHLFLNMYGLLLAAIFVEPVYGRTKFFVIYFFAGVSGSLASIWWYENTVSVGASGAIFGLFGAIFSLALMGRMRWQDLAWLWVFVGINLLLGLSGGIDNAAHLGGLIAGVLAGVLLQIFTQSRTDGVISSKD